MNNTLAIIEKKASDMGGHMDFRVDFEQLNQNYPLKTKRVNGLTFNYRLGGSGEKVIVLLVGGIGFSDAFFRHFIEFAKSFTVLAFDYPLESCRNSVLADGIAELIKSLGFTKVFFVGQSYGGLIAQVIAKRHPEIVAGLVLSNTACLDANMCEEAKKPMLRMLKTLKKAILLTRLVPMSLLRKILLRRMERHLLQYTPDENKYLAELFGCMFNRLTGRHERNMCSLMLDLENELDCTKDTYSYLDKKVLLILSEDDETFGEPVKQALVNVMPNPVVNREISGGHLAVFYKTDLYINTVTQFINGIG